MAGKFSKLPENHSVNSDCRLCQGVFGVNLSWHVEKMADGVCIKLSNPKATLTRVLSREAARQANKFG